MKRIVIIVEDEGFTRSMIAVMLEKAGFDVVQCETAERCLEVLQHVVPQALILDYHLPGLDGYAAAQQIRANPTTAEIPIIFVTAFVDQDFIGQVQQLPQSFVISKPFLPSVFMQRFEDYLGQAQSQAVTNSDTKPTP